MSIMFVYALLKVVSSQKPQDFQPVNFNPRLLKLNDVCQLKISHANELSLM